MCLRMAEWERPCAGCMSPQCAAVQMPDDTSSIQSLGIGNGDSLTVREGNMAAAAEAAEVGSLPD